MHRTASTRLDVVPDGNDVIDQVFEGANPNPARLGCPGRNVLAQLAARALPIGHTGYCHLAQCSPCYREFRTIQAREGELATPRKRGQHES